MTSRRLQNATAFVWTKPRAEAAVLVADDALTDEEIGARVGVHRVTLAEWKRRPEFQDRVAEHVATFRKKVVARGVADRQNRVDALNDRWGRMNRVILARAAEYAGAPPVPGAEEGLHVRTVKLSATGDQVEEFSIDTGLLKELRAHEEQAAKELGQWVEKQEHSGEMLVRQYVGVPVDEV